MNIQSLETAMRDATGEIDSTSRKLIAGTVLCAAGGAVIAGPPGVIAGTLFAAGVATFYLVRNRSAQIGFAE